MIINLNKFSYDHISSTENFLNNSFFQGAMVLDQQRSKRKPSGGRLKNVGKKKKSALGRDPTHTKIGKRATRVMKVRGGNEKRRLITENVANVVDKKTNKFSKAKIEMVIKNPANRHFVRRNIITKGTILKTDKGSARVLSRPGQDGVINAELI